MDTQSGRAKKAGSALGRLFGRQSFFLVAIILLLAIAAGIINPKFFVIRNLLNILEQISVLGLVAAGATILIISGNFDISVGSIIGLSTCSMAILINEGVSEIGAM